MRIHWLDASNPPQFPNTQLALSEPNGLLAAGGSLSPEWLIAAYQNGIFPWYNEGDPILWWSPSPRMVFYPDAIYISRSLRKALKRQDYTVTINTSFIDVVSACAAPRGEQEEEAGTWINHDMSEAYQRLHELGYAHSVEVWHGEDLVGGLYGVALDKVFFGESMFSRATNGSKIALVHLAQWLKEWQYELIDCQVYNDHLDSLGAIELNRIDFEHTLKNYAQNVNSKGYPEWKPQDITRTKEYWTNLRADHESS